MSGLGNSSDKCSKIVVTPSLLMRLFEWCHEDAANDVAMHKVFEKIIRFFICSNGCLCSCWM